MTEILMPKATAVWLVDNTSLTFEQIAAFCGLHPLEVNGIADGEVARDIRGADLIANGQLSREELDRAGADPELPDGGAEEPASPSCSSRRRRRRATRPCRAARIVRTPSPGSCRNHPEVSDAQISKLLGTTKATIDQVRNRQHWNAANIKPVDPVTLGLSGQLELDDVVRKAADKKAKDDAKKGIVAPDGATLKPASETQVADADEAGNRLRIETRAGAGARSAPASRPQWWACAPRRVSICSLRWSFCRLSSLTLRVSNWGRLSSSSIAFSRL